MYFIVSIIFRIMKVSLVLLAVIAYVSAGVIPSLDVQPDFDAAHNGLSPLFDWFEDDNKIVGGNVVPITSVPWIVSMQRFGAHRCGASIIRNNRILTAAHCLHDIAANTLTVRAGSALHASGGQVSQVSRLIHHPQYSRQTLQNDITVMWLATPLSLGAGVVVIPLPLQGAGSATGALAVVAGWGHTTQGGQNSPQLRSVSVPIVDQELCRRQNLNVGLVTPSQICAGFAAGGRDSCQNDSGGPLTLNGQQVGVVSWGSGCARPNFPGVYARVSFYRNWINANL